MYTVYRIVRGWGEREGGWRQRKERTVGAPSVGHVRTGTTRKDRPSPIHRLLSPSDESVRSSSPFLSFFYFILFFPFSLLFSFSLFPDGVTSCDSEWIIEGSTNQRWPSPFLALLSLLFFLFYNRNIVHYHHSRTWKKGKFYYFSILFIP